MWEKEEKEGKKTKAHTVVLHRLFACLLAQFGLKDLQKYVDLFLMCCVLLVVRSR